MGDVLPGVLVSTERAYGDVALGDLGELGRVGEIVDKLPPRSHVVAVVIAVVFDPAGLVAPDGSPGRAGWSVHRLSDRATCKR